MNLGKRTEVCINNKYSVVSQDQLGKLMFADSKQQNFVNRRATIK